MAEDLTILPHARRRINDGWSWWADRWLRYNIGLLIAGPLGLVCYAAAVSRCIDLQAPGDWEITFRDPFPGLRLSCNDRRGESLLLPRPWSERFLDPRNVEQYRKIAFRLGFWFSVLLPFTPAAILFVSCFLDRGEEKKIILELIRTAMFGQLSQSDVCENLPRVLLSEEKATVCCSRRHPGPNSSAGSSAPLRRTTTYVHGADSLNRFHRPLCPTTGM
jgi:hypothetical protein